MWWMGDLMMSSMPVMRTPMMALMLAMAAGLSLAQAGERQPCQVSKVADGDTLTCFTPLGQKLRVRFAAIDTPEINQAHGKAAGARLEGLVLYKNVDLRILNTDRYGRKVKFGGTMCYDRYGDSYIVKGSRHIIHYY